MCFVSRESCVHVGCALCMYDDFLECVRVFDETFGACSSRDCVREMSCAMSCFVCMYVCMCVYVCVMCVRCHAR